MSNTGTRKTALVTGASSGIGLEIAELLALRGYDLFLVSNDEQGLKHATSRIQKTGITVFSHCMNLAEENAATNLYSFIKELDVDIEILVNNAGFFFFKESVQVDPEQAGRIINLHIRTVSELCILLGKEMKEKRRGYILNTSSIAAYKAFPGIAFYGATKAYIKSFSRSLRSELKVYGVHVTTLSPGATATNLYNDKGVNVELGRKLGVMMSARSVAKAGVRGLFRNRSNVVPGVLTKVMLGVAVLIPHGLIYRVVKRGGWLK